VDRAERLASDASGASLKILEKILSAYGHSPTMEISGTILSCRVDSSGVHLSSQMKITIPLFILLFALVYPALADRFVSGQTADVVLGQPDFITGTAVPANPNRLVNPIAAAMDPATGKVFVADEGKNRILRYSSAAAALTGSNPEAVFGQPNFTATQGNQGGSAGPRTLSSPRHVTVDFAGRLWVTDRANHRILGYFASSFLGNNPPADYVFGQPDFITTTSGTTSSKVSAPESVAVGSDDTLWVSDTSNSRILRFANVSTKTSGAAADGVLGQVNFITGSPGLSASKFKAVRGISVDASGRLWVADSSNNRVLRFDDPVTAADADGGPASGVLGQADFVSELEATTATGMSAPTGVFAAPDGILWVGDQGNERVLGFPAAAGLPGGSAANVVLGQSVFTTKDPGTSAQRMIGPFNVSGGPGGGLFVADVFNNRVLRFSAVPSPRLTLSTKTRRTSKATLPIRGVATGQVSSVTYRVGNRGSFRTASGTTSWTFKAKLKAGRNQISVIAAGPGGSSNTTTLSVTLDK
jgi:sugar lactone lactonase YvrE